MRKRVSSSLAAAALLLCTAASARADLTIRQRQSSLPDYEETLYLKGTSQRRETKRQRNGQTLTWAWLDDCIHHRFIGLNLSDHTYTLYTNVVPAATDATFNVTQFPPIIPPRASKGVWTETTAVTDTGERRQMFGFTARRLLTRITWAGEPNACDTSKLRMEIDGWYVDLLYGLDCSPDISGASPRLLIEMPSPKCMNKFFQRKYLFQRNHKGPPLGFPLNETTRLYNERGLVSTRTQEVLALSTATLDDALFAIPPDYVRVEPEQRKARSSIFARALSFFDKS